MPRFGGFETTGAPAEVTQERGFVATVWQARKVGGGDSRLYAVKVYCARQASPPTTAAEEGLNGQRHRAFLEGIKQLKQAGAGEKSTNLTPIYESGFADEGAWYATEFYSRGSLKTWISRLGEIDSAGLRHVLHEVILGCLSLKEARGSGHGNIKPANVFLTGKPRPLRQTRLVLADPYPAAPLKLAQLDLANRSTTELSQPFDEAQDLRALGELILQLVEERLLRKPGAYIYPILISDRWQKLGVKADEWLQLCNRLLDPELSLDKVNLASLERETRPEEPARKVPGIVTPMAVACLVVLLGVVAVKYFKPSGDRRNATTGNSPTEDATNALQAAEAEFARGNYSEVQSICAKYLRDPRFADLAQSAIAEQQALQHAQQSFAAGDYSFVERLGKSGAKPPVAALLKQAEQERQLLNSLWALTNSMPELKRRLGETEIARIKKPPFEQLRAWANQQTILAGAQAKELETAQTLLQQGDYQEVLALCARHPSDSGFTSLAATATAEQQQLEQARQRFASGDYSFIEALGAQAYSSKGPFTDILNKAAEEKQLLAELRTLTNSIPELEQRLNEPQVLAITKPPFQELREWAKRLQGRVAAQSADLKRARDLLAQGSYTNVLAICAQHPDAPQFEELAASARLEQTELTKARTSFAQGDYRFIDSLGKKPFSNKPAVAGLLAEAKDEQALLGQLQGLKQKGDWGKLFARMAKPDVGQLNKPPFEELRESLVARHRDLVVRLRRLQARLGTLPRGEKTPLDLNGKPIVQLSRNQPATIYQTPLKELKQDFQELDLLTDDRKREFDELEKAIFKWFDTGSRF